MAKGFAREVCERMAADSPDRFLVNMAKAKRGGKIFLDYLRNDRMSTAVAPLSPRARPGAPVSMPLTWKEVKPGLDPMRYTLRTVPALLAKTKAGPTISTASAPWRTPSSASANRGGGRRRGFPHQPVTLGLCRGSLSPQSPHSDVWPQCRRQEGPSAQGRG